MWIWKPDHEPKLEHDFIFLNQVTNSHFLDWEPLDVNTRERETSIFSKVRMLAIMQHDRLLINIQVIVPTCHLCNTIWMMSNQPRSRHTQKLVRYMLRIMSAIGLSSGQLGIHSPRQYFLTSLSGLGSSLPRGLKKTLWLEAPWRMYVK
jgi:hypothetical protein